MRFTKSIIAGAALALSFAGSPGFAQVAPIVDIAAIQRACTSAEACKAAVAAAIAAIEAAGLPPAAVNTELGNLAAAVVEVAKEADAPIEVADVVEILEDIKDESTDTAQVSSFEEVIAEVQDSGVDDVDTDSAFGSSEAG